MTIRKMDLVLYGSATMPDDDSTLNIGGAIDTSKKISFKNPASATELEAVSENAGDTTQDITIVGRIANGAKKTEVISLNGQTPAQAGTPETFARILKATKSATTAGTVALMSTTNEHTGTATDGGVDALGNPYIDLDAGASAVDGEYEGMVLRTTGGTGPNQIADIIEYDGSAKRAYVSKSWAISPDATTTFEIAPGVVFEKTPNEILEIRRPHFDEAAPQAGGSDKMSYDKGFLRNNSTDTAATNVKISEVAEGISAKEAFALETSIDGTGTNGAGNNRNVAPSTGVGTFDSSEKTVPGDANLEEGEAIGIWFEFDLNAGDSPDNSYYKVRTTFNSI